MPQFINVGFGNMVAVAKIVAIITPDGAPAKRAVQMAKDDGKAIDATHGRKTRAVIFMEDGQLVLSALQPETITGRVDDYSESET